MSFKLLCVAPALLLCLCGCSDSSREIAALKEELRTYRFEYAKPKIEVVILKKEILEATTEAGYPRLIVTGMMRQVGSFPLDGYRVRVELEAKIGDLKRTIRPSVTMSDGAAAFTETDTIWSLSSGDIPRNAKIEISITDFFWTQIEDHKKCVSLKSL